MPTQPINPFLGNPFEPGSGMGNWWEGIESYQNTTPYNYNPATFDPNNPFGTTMINPITGESFAITPDMQITEQWRQSNLNDSQLAGHGWMNPGGYKGITLGGKSFASMDPQGNLNFNPGAMSGMFGAMGGGSAGGGYDFSDYPTFTPYQAGEIPTVGPYEVSDFAQQIVDTNNVINAAMPGIYEQQEKGFANAANRMGQSGMAMSTPYAEALGEVSRKSGNDIAALTEAYRYNASEALAGRRMEEELQQRQLEEQAWAQQQQLNMAAQMANQNNQYNAWNAQNQWNANQWGAQNTLGMENYWQGQEQQQNQQAMMAQIMAQIMGQIPQGGGMGMP